MAEKSCSQVRPFCDWIWRFAIAEQARRNAVGRIDVDLAVLPNWSGGDIADALCLLDSWRCGRDINKEVGRFLTEVNACVLVAAGCKLRGCDDNNTVENAARRVGVSEDSSDAV